MTFNGNILIYKTKKNGRVIQKVNHLITNSHFKLIPKFLLIKNLKYHEISNDNLYWKYFTS